MLLSQVVSQVTSTGKPNLGGPWTLVDVSGIPRTERDYLGGYVLLYFGFTFCPDICPAELVKVCVPRSPPMIAVIFYCDSALLMA